MNLRILFLILFYYTIISLFFLTGGAYLGDASTNVNLNESSLTSAEIDTGGLFNTGVSFGRFFTLIGFGIGLPSDTPVFMQFFFFAWQTLITIFSVGFIISSIWDG